MPLGTYIADVSGARSLEDGSILPYSTPPPPPASTLRFGTYMGQFQASAVAAAVGKLPDFSTYYYQVNTAGVPAALNVANHKAEIDLGIIQVIDLDYKAATSITMAQVAAGAADAALTTWLTNLDIIADYGASKGVETWFSFVHEAIVHINGAKFAAGTPTTAQMASAYNHVMGMCESLAPNTRRVYWFGGLETKVGGVAGGVAFGDQLDPHHIQAVTFDPYRFQSHPNTEPPETTFGSVITALQGRSWFAGKPWGLTEYGTTQVHGDANNATWINASIALLRANEASIAVYFDRNTDQNYIITDGTTPLSLASYKAAVNQ